MFVVDRPQWLVAPEILDREEIVVDVPNVCVAPAKILRFLRS
jgi:hypothetical protein